MEIRWFSRPGLTSESSKRTKGCHRSGSSGDGGAAVFSLLSTGRPCSEGAQGDQFGGACRAALRVS